MTRYVLLDDAPAHLPMTLGVEELDVETGEPIQLHVGDEFDAELDEQTERALIAAGWVEPVKAKRK